MNSEKFVQMLYIIGSVCFLVGSIVSYVRAP